MGAVCSFGSDYGPNTLSYKRHRRRRGDRAAGERGGGDAASLGASASGIDGNDNASSQSHNPPTARGGGKSLSPNQRLSEGVTFAEDTAQYDHAAGRPQLMVHFPPSFANSGRVVAEGSLVGTLGPHPSNMSSYGPLIRQDTAMPPAGGGGAGGGHGPSLGGTQEKSHANLTASMHHSSYIATISEHPSEMTGDPHGLLSGGTIGKSPIVGVVGSPVVGGVELVSAGGGPNTMIIGSGTLGSAVINLALPGLGGGVGRSHSLTPPALMTPPNGSKQQQCALSPPLGAQPQQCVTIIHGDATTAAGGKYRKDSSGSGGEGGTGGGGPTITSSHSTNDGPLGSNSNNCMPPFAAKRFSSIPDFESTFDRSFDASTVEGGGGGRTKGEIARLNSNYHGGANFSLPQNSSNIASGIGGPHNTVVVPGRVSNAVTSYYGSMHSSNVVGGSASTVHVLLSSGGGGMSGATVTSTRNHPPTAMDSSNSLMQAGLPSLPGLLESDKSNRPTMLGHTSASGIGGGGGGAASRPLPPARHFPQSSSPSAAAASSNKGLNGSVGFANPPMSPNTANNAAGYNDAFFANSKNGINFESSLMVTEDSSMHGGGVGASGTITGGGGGGNGGATVSGSSNATVGFHHRISVGVPPLPHRPSNTATTSSGMADSCNVDVGGFGVKVIGIGYGADVGMHSSPTNGGMGLPGAAYSSSRRSLMEEASA